MTFSAERERETPREDPLGSGRIFFLFVLLNLRRKKKKEGRRKRRQTRSPLGSRWRANKLRTHRVYRVEAGLGQEVL